ncbi:MAG: hypothetical protein ACRDZ1_09950 [Acidimicrobiia bacterium]
MGILPALRRLFAKFADLKSEFFRLPFFLDLVKERFASELFMARMERRPPGMFEFGRKGTEKKVFMT